MPLPQVADFADLNAHLLTFCQQDDARVVTGEPVSIGTQWPQEHPLLRPLPAHPLAYAPRRTVRLNRSSQVEVETTRSSVPVDLARPTLTLIAAPFTITIQHAQQVLATHPRCYDRQRDLLDPLQYLPLLRQRPGSCAHAAPLRQWREQWPPDYERLLCRFQERHPDGQGVREFLEVRSLHRHYPAALVADAITLAVSYGCGNASSVLALLRQLHDPPAPTSTRDLSAQPRLQAVAPQPLDLHPYDQVFAHLAGENDAR